MVGLRSLVVDLGDGASGVGAELVLVRGSGNATSGCRLDVEGGAVGASLNRVKCTRVGTEQSASGAMSCHARSVAGRIDIARCGRYQ